jgi:hypothetical protein
MNWEDDIRLKNAERVLSLAYQVANVNEFEKAIVDDLSYSEDFRIEKTGKEVKEKLQLELLTLASQKIAAGVRMESLVKDINQLPSGKPDQWQIRGFEKYLGEVPRQYSYAQIYPNEKNPAEAKCEPMYDNDLNPTSFPGGITPTVTKEIIDKMREYNQVAGDYIRGCIDEIKLKTVIDNLQDGKKIKLAPQLASQLGF